MTTPRIMYYHDGRHPLIYMYEPPMQKEEYEQAVDELVGTPVDALMFCLGDGRTVLHDSKVGELWGTINEKWDHIIFRRAHQNARHLIEAGNDPLRIVCVAIVMDLYSRRIVGWHIDKRMTTDLISKALMKAYNLRQPPKGLVFHSDRGSQYTSKRFGKLLKGYGIRASMGDVGACWDNAVVERFFGSLKHDWIFKVAQPTREHMKQDVTAYIRYYNQERFHSSNGDMSPVKFEISQIKVSCLG